MHFTLSKVAVKILLNVYCNNGVSRIWCERHHKTTWRSFVAYKMTRNNTVNKYVWIGNRTKSLSDCASVYSYRRSSVVCPMIASHAKTAESIDMPFWVWTPVSPRMGSRSSPREWAILTGGEWRWPIVKYPTVCSKLCKNGWTDRDACSLGCWVRWVQGTMWWGAHWRNQANTIEPSMCGGYMAMSNYFDHLLFHYPWHLQKIRKLSY